MTHKLCHLIYNNDDKETFRFPKYTLLDDIPVELWDNIMKYHMRTFYVGHDSEQYEGFHKMQNRMLMMILKRHS